ncbi:transposase IS116/IS110/IS902 family protein, partial [Agrobacterium albertimagni AOL15]
KPQKKGNKPGPAYAYNVKKLRDQEMRVAEQAQKSYERFVETWRPRPPDKKARGRLNPARLE